MKPVTITIIKYSGILLATFLISWWAKFFSPLNIPDYIPHTPIRIYGLVLSGSILTVLILSQKELLKKKATLGIVDLVLFATTICFINEVIFHFILSFTDASDKLYYFITGVISTTILCAFLSFFVAFQIKTKRTGQLLLFILAFMILFKVLTMVFPTLVKS